MAASRLHRDLLEAAMRVYEVMSKAVETVKPAVHASEAKTRMRQLKIHHLVVKEGSELQGIVSDRDGKVAGIVTVADLLEQLAKKPEHKSNRDKSRAAETKVDVWDD
jgi:CBS domain-containing protein